jgi:hypothetical protein
MLYQYPAEQKEPMPDVVIGIGILWLLPILWIAAITSSWVKIPADAYAIQLLAACDTLGSPGDGKRRNR